MTTVADIRDALNQLHGELRSVVETVEPEVCHWKMDDETWSVAQILAHVAEFEGFFSDDVRRMHAEPGTRFGRTMEHERRLNAVKLTGDETVPALLSTVDTSHRQVLDVFSGLSNEDLNIEGVNPKFGTKTIEWVIDHFIVKHLEKHVGQLHRTIEAYRSA